MPMDREGQEMLVLSGLAYRGFYAGLLRGLAGSVVRGDLEHGLNNVRPVAGEWHRVWGPATSRMVGDQFDSSAAYLVRHRQSGTRYVLAVRGTNPISLTDWLFGDFNVTKMVRWPFGDGGAAVSTSTAHGLAALLALAPRNVDLHVAGLADGCRFPTCF